MFSTVNAFNFLEIAQNRSGLRYAGTDMLGPAQKSWADSTHFQRARPCLLVYRDCSVLKYSVDNENQIGFTWRQRPCFSFTNKDVTGF